jgi:hypothetical protein
MYAFLLDGRGILILKTDQAAETEEIIRNRGLRSLSEADLLA